MAGIRKLDEQVGLLLSLPAAGAETSWPVRRTEGAQGSEAKAVQTGLLTLPKASSKTIILKHPAVNPATSTYPDLKPLRKP
jgi:hypothetical protein